jgi:S-adenosylmethionine synthetase
VLRRIAEAAVEEACAGRATPRIVLNGAGMFVAGGPNGDNGLAGKKLVVDAYGPGVPIGGGAWSGKDFRKVDRLGGLLARAMARSCIARALGREALVTLEYTPGCAAPVFVEVCLDGGAAPAVAEALHEDAGTGNDAAWRRFVACERDLVDLARWGHQQAGTPWETAAATHARSGRPSPGRTPASVGAHVASLRGVQDARVRAKAGEIRKPSRNDSRYCK